MIHLKNLMSIPTTVVSSWGVFCVRSGGGTVGKSSFNFEINLGTNST